jgi:NAD(P)H-hydrate epimerase
MQDVNIPEIPVRSVPSVDDVQMKEVDRLMTDVYGIHLLQMMELAGFHGASLVRTLFPEVEKGPGKVVVCCGTGGNGGGGMSCARHLHNAGVKVSLVLSRTSDTFTGAVAGQFDTVSRMGLPVLGPPSLPHEGDADTVWIDALIGYGLKGEPTGRVSELITFLNATEGSVISLDVPSGLDSTLGAVGSTTIRSTLTLTLALPKKMLFNPGASAFVGDLYLADIGVPPGLYGEPSLQIQVDEALFPAPLVRLV